jgi:hypothetical protein
MSGWRPIAVSVPQCLFELVHTEENLIYIQFRGRPRWQCCCDLSRTAHDLKGLGLSTVPPTTVTSITPHRLALLLRSSICSRPVLFA